MPSLLPPSATTLEYSLTQVDTERSELLPIPHRTLWSADTCPEGLLPWLAWALSVDVWRDTWPTSVKRAAIKNAADSHRKKGTAGAVKKAIAALGSEITITEWWQTEPKGAPYTFAVEFTPSSTLPNDPDFQVDIINTIDAVKNLRSAYTVNVKTPALITLPMQGILRTACLAVFST